jgi:NAD(P)-dependent dehydrogenase (short-subunit alcohol dehydrogenase family)
MTQRNWLITGISSGFGREMTEQLLARGDRVAGTVRNLSAIQELKVRYRDQLWLAQLDMTEISNIRSVVDHAFRELGRIDVVVSNAGYGLIGAAEEVTDEQVLHQLNTNLVGAIFLVRAAMPHLRRQGGGRILQLSTMGGQAAFPGGSLYHASKWGIEGFIDSVSQEVAGFNIGCTIVEPGSARTDFRSRSSQVAPKIDAYENSPVAFARRMVANTAPAPGDPAKMVELMIASVEQSPAPKRLALGIDAYTVMHKQLSERLAALEAQKTLAASTDFPAA